VPLMRQLGNPAIFCHNLVVDGDRLVGYRLRLPDQKRASVRAFAGLGFSTLAMGDSYNDTGMLTAASVGLLFRPPQRVMDEFPGLPVVTTYAQAQALIAQQEGRSLA